MATLCSSSHLFRFQNVAGVEVVEGAQIEVRNVAGGEITATQKDQNSFNARRTAVPRSKCLRDKA